MTPEIQTSDRRRSLGLPAGSAALRLPARDPRLPAGAEMYAAYAACARAGCAASGAHGALHSQPRRSVFLFEASRAGETNKASNIDN